jgi:hypothetical protein
MSITVLKGKASRVTKGQRVTQGIDSQGAAVTPIYVTNTVGMLIDNKPVSFWSRGEVLIRDGDEVSAAGIAKNGVLDAKALRNDSAGLIFYFFTPSQANMQIIGAVLLVLCGFWFIRLVPMIWPIALIFFGCAYWVFKRARMVQSCTKAVGG